MRTRVSGSAVGRTLARPPSTASASASVGGVIQPSPAEPVALKFPPEEQTKLQPVCAYLPTFQARTLPSNLSV